MVASFSLGDESSRRTWNDTGTSWGRKKRRSDLGSSKVVIRRDRAGVYREPWSARGEQCRDTVCIWDMMSYDTARAKMDISDPLQSGSQITDYRSKVDRSLWEHQKRPTNKQVKRSREDQITFSSARNRENNRQPSLPSLPT